MVVPTLEVSAARPGAVDAPHPEEYVHHALLVEQRDAIVAVARYDRTPGSTDDDPYLRSVAPGDAARLRSELRTQPKEERT